MFEWDEFGPDERRILVWKDVVQVLRKEMGLVELWRKSELLLDEVK